MNFSETLDHIMSSYSEKLCNEGQTAALEYMIDSVKLLDTLVEKKKEENGNG